MISDTIQYNISQYASGSLTILAVSKTFDRVTYSGCGKKHYKSAGEIRRKFFLFFEIDPFLNPLLWNS